MIISVRGTNGSGKSTVVRRVLYAGVGSPRYGRLGIRLPEAYRVELPGVERPLFVIGPYVTDAGGCDQLHPYELVIKLLEEYAPQGHVLFEGVLVASNYGRIGEWMEGFGQQAVMLFLTTSLEDCIARVGKRRAETLARKYRAADAKELDPSRLKAKYDMITRIRKKVMAAGVLRSVDATAEEAPERIIALLREG